jgi:hypothetical protein
MRITWWLYPGIHETDRMKPDHYQTHRCVETAISPSEIPSPADPYATATVSLQPSGSRP